MRTVSRFQPPNRNFTDAFSQKNLARSAQARAREIAQLRNKTL